MRVCGVDGRPGLARVRRGCALAPSCRCPASRPVQKLSLRSNGTRVVLNDSRSGAAWAVQANGQLINNWDDLIAPKDQQQQQQKKNEDTPPQVEKQQLPPVAVDDNLGARPGRASVLPVLLNDYDPNGDVISITGDTGISPDVGRLDLINNHQELQITLDASASGVISLPLHDQLTGGAERRPRT